MTKTRGELPWVDFSKGVAMVWIFWNHTAEQILGYPLIGNPAVNWPPLGERLAQLRWMDGFDWSSTALNLFRYVGWAGDQGVGLFLMLSGFGLTWGQLQRHGSAAFPVGPFYVRRAERIYPLWWTAHLVFVFTYLMIGRGLSLADPATYLSLAGVRMTPRLFYYFTPAWWYIGLLIQLYLFFPVLWQALRTWGPAKMLVVTCAVSFGLRLAGLFWFDDYVAYWNLGALFPARLPEFALGIFLATRFDAQAQETDSRLRSFRALLAAAAIYIAGIFLAITLAGLAVAPFLLCCGATVLLYGSCRAAEALTLLTGSLRWIGKHSYSLFLAHHPIVRILLPFGAMAPGKAWTWASVFVCAAASVVFALVLESMCERSMALIKKLRANFGLGGMLLRLTGAGSLVAALFMAAELGVRRFEPQEVLGWGEKPSLEPHPEFGWRLKLSRTTRLRWESYDYEVTSNSLGFPGPEYEIEKTASTFRVLVTGDAFSSAEGVDTAEAWPRLLEPQLAARLPQRKVEVLNFAITGYGPNRVRSRRQTLHADLQTGPRPG